MPWLFLQMELGYVSRVHPKDNFNHSVLTIQGYKPKEFAGQINLDVNNMWGILIKVCLNFLNKTRWTFFTLINLEGCSIRICFSGSFRESTCNTVSNRFGQSEPWIWMFFHQSEAPSSVLSIFRIVCCLHMNLSADCCGHLHEIGWRKVLVHLVKDPNKPTVDDCLVLGDQDQWCISAVLKIDDWIVRFLKVACCKFTTGPFFEFTDWPSRSVTETRASLRHRTIYILFLFFSRIIVYMRVSMCDRVQEYAHEFCNTL